MASKRVSAMLMPGQHQPPDAFRHVCRDAHDQRSQSTLILFRRAGSRPSPIALGRNIPSRRRASSAARSHVGAPLRYSTRCSEPSRSRGMCSHRFCAYSAQPIEEKVRQARERAGVLVAGVRPFPDFVMRRLVIVAFHEIGTAAPYPAQRRTVRGSWATAGCTRAPSGEGVRIVSRMV
jgi:hypothetical protein